VLLLRVHLLQSLGRSSAYHGIIATCMPAIVALVATLASNVSGGIAPHLQQHPLPPPPQQQQQQEQQQEQQLLLQQQELLWRGQQAIESSTAAAVRTAALGLPGSGSPAAGAAPAAAPAAPFPGGEDEVRVVFKLLRRLLELIKDIEVHCRCVCASSGHSRNSRRAVAGLLWPVMHTEAR
jgi:hypothetical protein